MELNPGPAVVEAFLPGAGEYRVEPLGSGLIHQTFLVTSHKGQHVFQALSSEVFPDLGKVMSNIVKVTGLLKSMGVPTLDFLPTSGGSYLAVDEKGESWRCSVHLPGTQTYDVPPSPTHLKNAARAFARFGRMLSQGGDLDLHPTIEDFHHTPRRFEAMEKAWDEASPERREPADYYALRHAATAFPEFGLDGLLASQVPQAVAHNDTKLNNCLFQTGTDKVVCVIDLDTVMEGSWLMDFGDLCRTSVCPLPEDTRDLDAVTVDLDRFRALVEGYAEVFADSITPPEQERMVYSVFLLTFELALRFFTDYLRGDRYFQTAYPEHNLVRTRSQLTLALKIAAARGAMEQMVTDVFRSHPDPQTV